MELINGIPRHVLVVKGFTDPDLTHMRAESPTLSNIGRVCLLQLFASPKLQIRIGHVPHKTNAVLQGTMGERAR